MIGELFQNRSILKRSITLAVFADSRTCCVDCFYAY